MNQFLSYLNSRLLGAVVLGGLLVLAPMPLSLWAATENEPLPELGDSAERILSPAREKAIGRQFLSELIRNPNYINDPELRAYLNDLGTKLAAKASLRGTPIAIHLIESPDVNAFAVPGGHITFHSGLISTAVDESELASVTGHEIAHISQRHLPRMLAKSEASKLPTAAAVLASVLVGGDAGLAGLAAANAAFISSQLAFTRDFEREADSIGIKLLADAGFDPSAMSRFFGKLDRHGGLGDGVPEFLRTHPLSYKRIAEAENRSSVYPPRDYPESRLFHLMRAKIQALNSPRNPELVAIFEDQVQKSSGGKKEAGVYGIALAQMQLRQFDNARATLQPLLDADANEPAFQIARARIDIAAGQPKLAVARYARLVEAHPKLAYLTFYQANALLAAGDAAGAKRVLRHQLRRNKNMFRLYLLLAKSNGKLGLLAEAHQATAEFHVALGENQLAIDALKLALRESKSEGYLHDSIVARLSGLEEKVKPTH